MAQKALGSTSGGYSKQPKLLRFRAHPDPHLAISRYFEAILEEAFKRGYKFKRELIHHPGRKQDT